MDVRDDKRRRCWSFVFDPMGARAEFGEDLAGVELLCGAIVMVIGQNPGHQVDDRRTAGILLPCAPAEPVVCLTYRSIIEAVKN
jgi:hypothetical protein